MNAISAIPPRGSLPMISVLVLVAAFSGCTTVHKVKVDAINNPNAHGGTAYRIVSKHPAVAQNDPDFANAVGLVHSALAGTGMYQASRTEEADVIVEIDYSVGPRRMKVTTETIPVGFNEAFAPNPRARAAGRSPVRKRADGKVEMLMGNVILRGTPMYEKQLTLVAREAVAGDAGDQHGAEIWRIQVSIEDEAAEVGPVLPVLAAAAVGHIGSDTEKQQIVKVPEDSVLVAFASNGP